MKEQITALLGVFTRPKQTMRQLSSRRIYILAIVSPLYFGIGTAFRPRNHDVLYDKLGGNLQIFIFVCAIAAVMIPLGAWLVRQFLKLFRKRLSIVKIMNIHGYAYVPRLVVAALGYIFLFAHPSFFKTGQVSLSLLFIIGLYFASQIYSLFLLIYGFVVSPSEDNGVADKTPQAASETGPQSSSEAQEG